MDNLENKNNKFLIRFGVLTDVCKYLIDAVERHCDENPKSSKKVGAGRSVEKMMMDIICGTGATQPQQNQTLVGLKAVETEISKLKTIYQIGIAPILNRPTSDPMRDSLFDEFIETENFHGWTRDIFKR